MLKTLTPSTIFKFFLASIYPTELYLANILLEHEQNVFVGVTLVTLFEPTLVGQLSHSFIMTYM